MNQCRPTNFRPSNLPTDLEPQWANAVRTVRRYDVHHEERHPACEEGAHDDSCRVYFYFIYTILMKTITNTVNITYLRLNYSDDTCRVRYFGLFLRIREYLIFVYTSISNFSICRSNLSSQYLMSNMLYYLISSNVAYDIRRLKAIRNYATFRATACSNRKRSKTPINTTKHLIGLRQWLLHKNLHSVLCL